MAWPYFDDDSISKALAAAGRAPLLGEGAAPFLPGQPEVTPQWVRDATPDAVAGVSPAPGVQPGGPVVVPPTSPYAHPAVPPEDSVEPPPAPTTPVPPERPQFGPTKGYADVTGAQRNEEVAALRAGQSKADFESQKLAAEGAKLGREADAVQQNTAARESADNYFRQQRAETREKAHTETMKWMAQLEENAAKEPNPHRYWKEQSGFGKALWLLASGLSLASQLGQRPDQMRPNPVLELLRSNIKDDIERQKAVIAAQRDTLKARGDIMMREQTERAADLKDDHTLEAERLLSLREAAKLRASQPGPEDQKLAYAAGVQWLDEQLVKVMGDRAHRSVSAADAAAARAQSAYEARMKREQDDRQFGAELQYKYDALQTSVAAKANKGDIEAKDLRTISRNTGFRIVGPDGKEISEITVPKDQHKDVADAVESAGRQSRLTQRLRSAYAKSSALGRTFKTDGEVLALIEEAAGAKAKDLNKGAMSEADRAVGYKALLGVDYSSLLARLKGPNKEETLAWLDKQIAQIPESAVEAVTARSGISLPPGTRIAYTPTEVQEAAEPTTESALAEAGVKPAPVAAPVTPAGVREAKKAGALPELPTGLAAPLEKFEAIVGRSRWSRGEELSARANEAIDAWEARNKDKPRTKDLAAHARARVLTALQDSRTGEKAENEELVGHFVRPTMTVEDAKEVGARYGVDLTTADAFDLIKAAKERARAANKLAPPFAQQKVD